MRPDLTQAEIDAICHPLKQYAAQCRFLARLGYRVDRRPDGSPLVMRAQLGQDRRASNGPAWSKRA